MSLKLGSSNTVLMAGGSAVKQMLLGSSPKFAAPVLDHVPNAAAAYSLRRLSNAYSGPVVKVRRSSDSATADFTAAEVSDGTLAAWVGAGDGLVHTWYDQSGNGRNATQATAGYQPKLVSSGVVVTEGGKPALQFDGVDDFLATSSPVPATNDFLATLVASGSSSGTSLERGFLAIDNNTGVGYATGWWLERSTYTVGDNIASYIAGDQFASPTGSLPLSGFPQTVISQERAVGVASRIYKNAAVVAEETATSNQRDAVIPSNILYVGDTLNKHIGTISEVLLYQSDVSASRELAEGEMAWHYGLQAKLPYDHPYSPQSIGGSSQRVPTDEDAITYLEAVAAADGAPVENGVALAINDFVAGLKATSAGIAADPTRTLWDAVQASCIMCGARTISGALVPLKGTAPTPNNFVSDDYNRSTGLSDPDATSWLDSNRAGNADGQDDCHISAYQSAAASGTAAMIGSTVTSPESRTMLLTSVTAFYPRVNNSVAALTVAAGGATTGLFAASRSSSASYLARPGTGDNFQRDVSSTAHQPQNIYIFAHNEDGSPGLFFNGRLAFYSIGSALDIAALDTKVTALVAAVSAALA